MIKQIFFVLSIALLLAMPAQGRIANPRAHGPLKTRVQNPLYLQFLALPIESAQPLGKTQMQTEVQTTFSNVFEYRTTGNTQLTFDMEIWRTALTYEYGITDNLDLKIELPFLSTMGGFLDEFIQSYHTTFGFPNGGRELEPNGQYRFLLINNGVTLFDAPSSPFGLSDMTLRAKFLLPESWHHLPIKIAVAPYIKLPTGKITNGFSSGYTDLGAALLVEADYRRFHFVTQAGMVIVSGHEKIDSILRNAFFQFGQSVEFQITNGLSAIAQLTGNTSAFTNVSASELTNIALDLNLGVAGSLPLNQRVLNEIYYQFSFSEDAMGHGPSVDFSLLFMAGVRY
jgi:hypothetical protein